MRNEEMRKDINEKLEVLISDLKIYLQAVDKECSSWNDSGDRGMCFAHNCYKEYNDVLEKLIGDWK